MNTCFIMYFHKYIDYRCIYPIYFTFFINHNYCSILLKIKNDIKYDPGQKQSLRTNKVKCGRTFQSFVPFIYKKSIEGFANNHIFISLQSEIDIIRRGNEKLYGQSVIYASRSNIIKRKNVRNSRNCRTAI
jgi:hypothetical protein